MEWGYIMRYLLMLDLEELKKNKKVIIYFLLAAVAYSIYNGMIFDFNFGNERIKIFLMNIGGFQKIFHLVPMIFTLFIFASYYYIFMKLFIKDFKFGPENIFLRISKNKWLNIKMINILIIMLLIETFTFLILLTVFFVTGNGLNLISVLKIFLADFFTKTLFVILSLIMYLLFNYYSIFILFLIILLSSFGNIYNLGFYLFGVNFIDNIWLLLICLLLLFLLLKSIFVRKSVVVFERSD